MRLDLPREREIPPDRLAARAARIEHHVTAAPARGRSRLLLGAGLGAALALSTGALAYRQWATPEVTDQVRCYTVASLEERDGSFFGTTAGQAQAADGRPQASPSPVEVCAMLWRIGLLRPGQLQPNPPAEDGREYPVPPLTACTLPNGIAAVFPGDERTCLRLGLPRMS
ncbi:hypothetical protein AB0M46_20275 [Dactylosporangium sp. NPDC051485]|uniref:hypothetical protein n=1 Tax=Dactylosporangium sp. NPDC051485 TaxID=3154846 RepID=UPI00342AED3B